MTAMAPPVPIPVSAACQQALEILSASLDGEARPDELLSLAEHLADCDVCRCEAGQWLHQDDVVREIAKERGEAKPGRSWRPWAWLAAAALVASIWLPLHRQERVNPDPQLDQLVADADEVLTKVQALYGDLRTPGPVPPPGNVTGNPFNISRPQNPFLRHNDSTSKPFERSGTELDPP